MGVKQSKLTISYLRVEESTDDSSFKTIPECLQYYSRCRPSTEAVVFVSADGRREPVTYLKLYESSCQAAHALLALGVKRDEFVAINVRPCPEWLYITFGAMIAGTRPFGLTFTYKDGSDLIALMEIVQECSTIVLDPGSDEENWKIFSKHLDTYCADGTVQSSQMPSLRYLICHDQPKNETQVMTLNQLMAKRSSKMDLPNINEDDIAILFETSGSTGPPKLVAHTHRSMININKFTDEDLDRMGNRVFSDRPIHCAGGFPYQIIYGQTMITLSGMSPPLEDRISFLIDVIRREHCDVISDLPSTIYELQLKKDELKVNWPLKTIFTGGQPVNKRVMSCIDAGICKNIIVDYSATEFLTSSINFISHSNDFTEQSVGHPVPGTEIKVVDSDGNAVPTNSSGEILIRSKGLFKEYYNNPKKTRAALTEDGWYRTDDIGRMFEDGALVVEGRKSNMIISGGINVAPESLEKIIALCPGVDSAVVVAVPDNVMYQVICVCVKTIPDYIVTLEDIRKFCEGVQSDNLGLFPVLPKYYMILEMFPKTFSGKTSRKEMTKMAIKMFLN